MSFFESASLVFISDFAAASASAVSGSGANTGKAYNIKPVDELGSELVINGGFDTDSDWSKSGNVVIANGVATFKDDGSNTNSYINQNILTVNKKYLVTLEVKRYVAGRIQIQTTPTNYNLNISQGVGSYSVYTNTVGGTLFRIKRNSNYYNFDFDIDNVSVKEVTSEIADFDFERGSDITATRVNSSGLIEKGRGNLFIQSNNFDTNWPKNKLTLTSGQSGYDGSTNAWKITSDDVGSSYLRKNIVSSGVQTASIYAAKGNVDYIYFRIAGSTNQGAFINLSNGTIDSYLNQENIIDISVNNVSGDWYRISITFNTTTSDIRFYVSDLGGSSSVSGSYIYTQDAQLEQGLVATDVIETTTAPLRAGVLEDEPRFDYHNSASSTPNTCPSLLLEPSRTNSIEQSEYFSGSDWSTNNTSVINNAIISPEGLLNGSKFIQDNGITSCNVRTQNTLSVVNGDIYTFSVFAKKGEVDKIQLDVSDAIFGDTNVVANLTNETLTAGADNTDEGIEDYGNGWYRIYVVGTAIATGTTARIFRLNNNGSGDGSKGIYVYGAQFEEGSYPTSYIPTYGTSDTRTADDLNDLDISSILPNSSFTWFLDLNDYIGSDANNVNIWIQSTSGIQIEFRVRPGGYRFYYSNIAGGSAYPIAGSTTANKFCVSYDGSNYRLYIDGTLEATTSSVGDNGWDKIRNSILAPLPLKQMLLFPTSLSDTDCEILTGATTYSSFTSMASALNYTVYE